MPRCHVVYHAASVNRTVPQPRVVNILPEQLAASCIAGLQTVVEYQEYGVSIGQNGS